MIRIENLPGSVA